MEVAICDKEEVLGKETFTRVKVSSQLTLWNLKHKNRDRRWSLEFEIHIRGRKGKEEVEL